MNDTSQRLLAEILEAQQQTNTLLVKLIQVNAGLLQALAEEEDLPSPPGSYLDGTQI